MLDCHKCITNISGLHILEKNIRKELLKAFQIEFENELSSIVRDELKSEGVKKI